MLLFLSARFSEILFCQADFAFDPSNAYFEIADFAFHCANMSHQGSKRNFYIMDIGADEFECVNNYIERPIRLLLLRAHRKKLILRQLGEIFKRVYF